MLQSLPSGQRTVASWQAPSPSQVISHGRPSGQVTVSFLQALSPVQSIWQAPAWHPSHSAEHGPAWPSDSSHTGGGVLVVSEPAELPTVASLEVAELAVPVEPAESLAESVAVLDGPSQAGFVSRHPGITAQIHASTTNRCTAPGYFKSPDASKALGRIVLPRAYPRCGWPARPWMTRRRHRAPWPICHCDGGGDTAFADRPQIRLAR